MRIACLTFTSSGEKLAEQIKDELHHEVFVFTREQLKHGLKNVFNEIFESYQGLIFISSTGIAVRYIAPCLKDKAKDPAVVVVDDLGRYSISLLSGHIGGANCLSEEVAGVIGAVAIITTASDGRGIEAVDMFALRHSFQIESMEDAKTITSMMVEGKRIKLISEIDVQINYNNITDDEPDGYIIVTSQKTVDVKKPCCLLRPKNLNIGIGCRRGKSKQEIMNAIESVFDDNNLSIKSIKSAGTIDVKKDEAGIIEACSELGCSLKIYSNQDIESVQDKFKSSSFVHQSVGVTSVAEPCAYLSGGSIIVGKTAVDGVTVAVSKED